MFFGTHKTIPERELYIDFIRSSGPGGQNVNKVSTKAQLRWNVGESAAFTEHEKNLIRKNLKTRLNKNDEIIVSCNDQRSQTQNKEKAILVLNAAVKKALVILKRRVATKPSYNSKLRRLTTKSIRSRVKQKRAKKYYLDE